MTTATTENQLLSNLISQLGGCRQAEDMTHIERLKAAICGDPKTGKSFLIAKTARKPLMHYDFDDRAESIAGQKDVIIKTLVDIKDTEPKAWAALESDIGTLEYAVQKKELPFKSIALDSMTFLRKYAEHQLLKDSGSITRTKFKIGVVDYLIPKDWDAVTGVQKMLETMLSRVFSLGIDVYVTFHTRNEKDQQRSTASVPVYKDKLTVEPQNLKMLLPKFNDTWRTYIEDGKYMVQLKPDWQFDASTVLQNVGQAEEADIQKLLDKHNKKVSS